MVTLLTGLIVARSQGRGAAAVLQVPRLPLRSSLRRRGAEFQGHLQPREGDLTADAETDPSGRSWGREGETKVVGSYFETKRRARACRSTAVAISRRLSRSSALSSRRSLYRACRIST